MQAFNPLYNSLEAYNREIKSINQEVNEIKLNLFNAYEELNYLKEDKDVQPQLSILALDTSIVNQKDTIVSYPNPFSNYTTIKIVNKLKSRYKLIIRDLTMRELEVFILDKENSIDLRNKIFSNQGVYFCTLENLDNVEINTIKLIYSKK